MGQDDPVLDTGKLATILRLDAEKLVTENVTEIEASARNLPLMSAWLISVPSRKDFHPLLIYTAKKGVLNSPKYDNLRNAILERTPDKGQFDSGFGTLDIPDVSGALVFMEQLRIASPNPAGIEGVNKSWRPMNEAGLSIIGTSDHHGMDFQIYIVFEEKDKIGDFPEYKSMLYGPDFPNVQELALALVGVVQASQLLEVADLRPVKRRPPGGGGVTRSHPEGADSLGETNGSGTDIGVDSAAHVSSIWPWLLGVIASLIAIVLFRRALQR